MTDETPPTAADYEVAAAVLEADMNHRLRSAIGDQHGRLDELGARMFPSEEEPQETE